MKRIIAIIMVVLVLCTLMLTACNPNSGNGATPDSVLTDKDIKNAIKDEAKAFASKDAKKINALLFGNSNLTTCADPLRELESLANFSGVGIDALSALFAEAEIEVKDIGEAYISYNITYPDMTNFFKDTLKEIKSTKKASEVTTLINNYAKDAQSLSKELTISYTISDESPLDEHFANGVHVNYQEREFADALTGGMVSLYEKDYEAEISAALADTRDYPVATAFSDTKENGEKTSKFRIPKINSDKGDAEKINEEIWTKYHDNIYNAEPAPSGETTTAVTYEWGVKGDVMSLVITQEVDYINNFYEIINISQKSGKRLDSSDVIKAAGLSEQEYVNTAISAIETKFFENSELTSVNNSNQAYVEQVNMILNRLRTETDILNETVPFFNADGKLTILAETPSLAGSDYYVYLLCLEDFTKSPLVGKDLVFKP